MQTGTLVQHPAIASHVVRASSLLRCIWYEVHTKLQPFNYSIFLHLSFERKAKSESVVMKMILYAALLVWWYCDNSHCQISTCSNVNIDCRYISNNRSPSSIQTRWRTYLLMCTGSYLLMGWQDEQQSPTEGRWSFCAAIYLSCLIYMWDKRNVAMRTKKFMSVPHDWSVESQILLWSNNEPLAIAQERNESLKTSQKSEAVQMRSQAKC